MTEKIVLIRVKKVRCTKFVFKYNYIKLHRKTVKPNGKNNKLNTLNNKIDSLNSVYLTESSDLTDV